MISEELWVSWRGRLDRLSLFAWAVVWCCENGGGGGIE